MKTFRLVWLAPCAVAMLWFALASQSHGQEVEAKLAKLEFLDCTVVDADGRPLENVQVLDCDRNYLFFELRDPAGNFRITLPPDCQDDKIGSFAFGRGSLKVVSKSPWRLTWELGTKSE